MDGALPVTSTGDLRPGYSAEYNSTYCKDGWTKAECEEWDDLEVNGFSWTFYKGQACDERGTPATP